MARRAGQPAQAGALGADDQRAAVRQARVGEGARGGFVETDDAPAGLGDMRQRARQIADARERDRVQPAGGNCVVYILV